MIARLLAWWARRKGLVWVRLELEGGGPPVLLGPMDRFAAELLIIHRVNPNPIHHNRHVVSARITTVKR